MIDQLIEFIYKYTSNVLSSSLIYAHHANRSMIKSGDVRLAVMGIRLLYYVVIIILCCYYYIMIKIN